MKVINVMGYDVFASDLSAIDCEQSKVVINTINPHSYVVAKADLIFREALNDSDILLPDGSGIVLAARYLNHEKIRKITGDDLHKHLLKKLNAKQGSCFYMGSSKETLEKIEMRLSKNHPDIRAGFYSPPYKDVFTSEENNSIIEAINIFKPDVLFVGMTAPKQEKWAYQFKNDIDAKMICSVGAVFDFYAGNTPRAPQWMISLHIEWIHRSIKSYRLFKRNCISNPTFLKYMILYKWSTKG